MPHVSLNPVMDKWWRAHLAPQDLESRTSVEDVGGPYPHAQTVGTFPQSASMPATSYSFPGEQGVWAAGLRPAVLSKVCWQGGPWLGSGNLAFRSAPTIPRIYKSDGLWLNILYKQWGSCWTPISFCEPWIMIRAQQKMPTWLAPNKKPESLMSTGSLMSFPGQQLSHMRCHDLLLVELSTSCVMPLGEDSGTVGPLSSAHGLTWLFPLLIWLLSSGSNKSQARG